MLRKFDSIQVAGPGQNLHRRQITHFFQVPLKGGIEAPSRGKPRKRICASSPDDLKCNRFQSAEHFLERVSEKSIVFLYIFSTWPMLLGLPEKIYSMLTSCMGYQCKWAKSLQVLDWRQSPYLDIFLQMKFSFSLLSFHFRVKCLLLLFVVVIILTQ